MEVAVPADFEVRPRTTVQHPSERLSDTRPTSDAQDPRYFSPIGPLPLAVQMLPQGVQLIDAGQVVEAEDGVGMALALNLVLVERWATRKHYENYLAWRQQRGDLDKFAAALAGPPSIRYFDLTSV